MSNAISEGEGSDRSDGGGDDHMFWAASRDYCHQFERQSATAEVLTENEAQMVETQDVQKTSSQKLIQKNKGKEIRANAQEQLAQKQQLSQEREKIIQEIKAQERKVQESLAQLKLAQQRLAQLQQELAQQGQNIAQQKTQTKERENVIKENSATGKEIKETSLLQPHPPIDILYPMATFTSVQLSSKQSSGNPVRLVRETILGKYHIVR